MERNVIQINVAIMINVDVSVKNIIYVKKVMNPATCNCENGEYLASDMDKIICDEIIDVKETNFNEQNITCKTQSFNILLVLLLIAITLLIAVSIYCYLIKYQAKQKHLLPFHDTKLEQILY